jgi:hypothetical protein
LNDRHEKEGIPGTLLNMVDVNVVIPQTGIVRSLNVHVAASVGIWEYVRSRGASAADVAAAAAGVVPCLAASEMAASDE